MIITVPCPRCGEPLECEATYDSGDTVPYGSTTARTPASWEVDVPECPGHSPLTSDEYDRVAESVVTEADDAMYDADDGEDRFED